MKVVIAIDSLKGSLTSNEAGQAIKDGVLSVYHDADVKIIPVADGGEGTVEALVLGMNGIFEKMMVTGPLGEKINATYGVLPESKTAIIEMAQASGLTLIPQESRNPLNTSTYGVGEIIKEAINKGCRNFIVGIGGSATNDAGVGMLQALGFEFYNGAGELIGVGGRFLNDIKSIKIENALKELADCTFKIACDVDNPLYGTNGAAHIYGPQKGATPEIVEELDRGLVNFARVVKSELGKDIANMPGAGAAGGLGYGFMAFLNGNLESGVNIIIEATKLDDMVAGADFLITGEGRLDYQTSMGKAPIGIAKIGKKHGAKVIAFAGSVSDDAKNCNTEGIDAYFSIQSGAISLEEAMDSLNASKNLRNITEQAFRLIKSVR